MAAPERLAALLAQNQVTGIDFVYVHADQTTLDVYFLRPPLTLAVPLTNLTAAAIHIYSPSGGERLAVVPIKSIAWVVIGGRDVLRVQTTLPGDFSIYRLRIDDARVDRFYNDVPFSFKANCPSNLDCMPAAHECPPEPPLDFPVDYTARDFWSFRGALLDFASQRYPRWQDRLEADVGNMLAEVMSELGDEFAYYQDRVGREAYFETATERRSLRRHAALVDYHVHDGLGATTWLDFQVNAAVPVPAGTQVSDPTGRVVYEVGRGLAESFAIAPQVPAAYATDPVRNILRPHQWDVDNVCLPIGSTELYIEGAHQADLPLDDAPPDKPPGRWVLLITKPTDASVTARAWMVRLIVVQDTLDPVLPPLPHPVTRLQWEVDQATPFELDLTVLEIHGNLVPATAGQTRVCRFTIGPSSDDVDRPSAIERTGPDSSVAYLFSLPDSDAPPGGPPPPEGPRGLVFLGPEADLAAPEIRLTAVTLVGNVWTVVQNGIWTWRPELLGTNSAQPTSAVFRLDDGYWRRIVGYQRIGTEIVHRDYATGLGKTIRFGDGEFGQLPAASTVFQVTYRLGNGTLGNVAAGTLTRCALAQVQSVTNPLPATRGVDPETPAQVRQLAPDAFRAITFRAVRPEDYAEAVERLPWVQRAGAAFRWTGSWLTAFATPDPKGSFTVTAPQRIEAQQQLDRFRQAGRPAYLLDPVYATLDLQITICVATSAYRGDVEERVLEALFGVRGIRPRPGFFSPENFTFSTPLERSQLEAAIQDVEGIKAVERIMIRRRGWFDWRVFSELTYVVAPNELIRVENNPLLPERGAVKLNMRGGA
jgi:hypothetical protein